MEKSEQNQSEHEQYLELVKQFMQDSFIFYRLVHELTQRVLLDHEKFKQCHPVAEMPAGEYERFLRAEKTIFEMTNETIEIGSKVLGIEHILEALEAQGKRQDETK